MSHTDPLSVSPSLWPEHREPIQARRHYRGRNQIPQVHIDWTTGMELPMDPPYWDDLFRGSVRVGLMASRKTLRPALAVWAVMLGTVLIYYLAPGSHRIFDFLGAIQQAMGVWFPSLGMGLSVGILVELVKVAFSKPVRWTRENTINACFNFAVFGLMGVTHHYRYEFQDAVFGGGNSFREIASKVAFDQFIWTVLIANPYQALCFFWKNNAFSWRAVISQMSPFRTFWGTQMLPVLISNWAFWIPMAFIIYSFPSSLQLPFSILAVTIWVMLLSVLTSLSRRDDH